MKKSDTNMELTRRQFLKLSSVTAAGLTTSALMSNVAFAGDGDPVSEEMVNVSSEGLFYETIGSGVPILVMHGGLGLDHSYFRPTLDSWGEFAQLHYYDHRGNGRSAAPSDWSRVTMDSYVEDAEALRKTLGLEKFVLFGHSYGGFIAQEYALRYQDNLAGLILASTSPNVGYEPNFPAWAPEEGLAAIGKIFGGPMPSDAEWAETWSAALPVYWKNPDPDLRADIHNRTQYKSAAWNNALGLLADFNTAGRLGQITIPTLILSGREDFVTGPTAHLDMHTEIPNSTLAFFENSGHFPFITEQSRYTAIVKDWLNKL